MLHRHVNLPERQLAISEVTMCLIYFVIHTIIDITR